MSQIVVPQLGESVVEARVARWLKKVGDPVTPGEPVVELETDKIDLEVGAEQAGVLASIDRQEGADVKVGELLAYVEPGDGASAAASDDAREHRHTGRSRRVRRSAPAPPAPAPSAPASDVEGHRHCPAHGGCQRGGSVTGAWHGRRWPGDEGGRAAVRRGRGPRRPLTRLQPPAPGSGRRSDCGPRGAARRLRPAGLRLQHDTRRQVRRRPWQSPQPFALSPWPFPREPGSPASAPKNASACRSGARRSPGDLVEAQHTAAMLTTFNEVDMSAVMALRARRKEAFQKRHGVSLGLSSFFVKASLGAPPGIPAPERRDPGRRDGAEALLRHRHRRRRERRPRRARAARRGRDVVCRDRVRRSRLREARRGRHAHARGSHGRHVHHHQRRRVRVAAVHAHPQPAAGRHPRPAQDRRPSRRRRRAGRR